MFLDFAFLASEPAWRAPSTAAVASGASLVIVDAQLFDAVSRTFAATGET